MALTLFSSNRVEVLQSSLALQLDDHPLRDPFATEIIVVPTYAMGRWLNLRLAQRQGVAANIQYPQPAQWIWQLASRITVESAGEDPFAPQVLAWRIFNRLPELIHDDTFGLLRRYLEDDASGVRRWQLAQRIATTFDRYQLYRPRQMRDWAAGADTHWQAALWRDLVATSTQAPRSEIIAEAIRLLGEDGSLDTLPERISLFALSSLAPILVEFIHALAGQTEILLYHHSPSDQYWADLQSEKARARERLQHPDETLYADSGNSLLASWGGQGQAMQDLLLDLGPVTRHEIDLNQAPGCGRMLQALQNSLFMLEDASLDQSVDESISVHLCHSPMRECQVLHDWLLSLLEQNAGLACEDIVVMVPEIDRYAPYIEAVFQSDDSARRPNLPWNISDISISVGHPLATVFLQLLQLPTSRFTRSEILAYLECAEIRERFGIADGMREDILQLLDTARVRWGIDAAQRAALGLPEIHENTWQQAWDRLFCGYAVDSDTLWQGVAPINGVDRDAAIALARFRFLFERLVAWKQRLASGRPANEWQQLLLDLIDEFFTPRSMLDEELQPLREAISELGRADTGELSPALVRHWMTRQLASARQSGRLYSGGITFCGMHPMRNIPFPVICVLGMQDSAFPRRDPALEFDLMRSAWRPGDPRHGDEDRYLMLETLLCARRYLYFSYCARSLKDNSECQPSPLLRELLDYIDEHFIIADDRRASALISHEHPMQAFSPRNFGAASPDAFDRGWFDTARQLQHPDAERTVRSWPEENLDATPQTSQVIELEHLLRFFSHPVRYFFNQRLGIRIPEERVIDDDEDFALDGLQKWKLAMRVAERYLQGVEPDLLQYRAEGLLPHGAAAFAEWDALQRNNRGLLAALASLREQTATARPVVQRLDDGRELRGEVSACYAGTGLVHFSASKSATSRASLLLWLNHVALCASGQLATDETSRLLLPGANGVEFRPLEASQASALLRAYLDLYAQGQTRPLPLFAETSHAWAQQQDPEAARRKARNAWLSGDFEQAPPGDRDDPFIRIALHKGVADPLDDPQFKRLAREVFGPLVAAVNAHD